MKIYFGEIDYENYESFIEFEGEEYDFSLEVTDDGVVIKDALDRYVPFNHAAALELYEALKYSKKYIKGFADAERAQEALAEHGDFAV
jgi:hypothetical protein